jgi:dihydrofolate reductase
MRELVYSMGVSLDGFISGPAGEIDWTVPDEEQHRFHNDEARQVGVHLYGRSLYETMVFWETAEDDPERTEVEREFARIWKPTPKLVFSTTLKQVEGEATIAARGVVEEVERLKAEPGKGLAVGGADLASTLVEHDLIDEYRLFTRPILLGEGRPFFPPMKRRIALELVETRSFGSRVVYTRYRRAGSD